LACVRRVLPGSALVPYTTLFRSRGQDTMNLTQWYHQYGEAGTQEAAASYAAAYSEVNPNVTVEMVWVPGDYSNTALPAALLTDEDRKSTRLQSSHVKSSYAVFCL